MSLAPPPLARAVVLTDDGTMTWTAALAMFDGTIAGLTLSTARITMHVLIATIADAAAALAPNHAALAAISARLTAKGV